MNPLKVILEGGTPDIIPVWFMRQAGRYLPGYTETRKSISIKEMCMDPSLLVKVMEEPIKRIGVDAAILFSDILLPLEAMDVKVDFADGIGPVVKTRRKADGEIWLTEFDEKRMKYPLEETIHKFKDTHADIPLIGFSGGPVTMLSYIIAEKADKDMNATKHLLVTNEKLFHENMSMLRDLIISMLKIQIRAGADVVQIFDSWAGFFSPYQFDSSISKYLSEIVSEISAFRKKIIYFSVATGGIAQNIADCGFDYISGDWRTRLSVIDSLTSGKTGLQGNLDPAIASGSVTVAKKETERILGDISYKDDYIFNLGHGVLPTTDYRTLKDIVIKVHEFGRRA